MNTYSSDYLKDILKKINRRNNESVKKIINKYINKAKKEAFDKNFDSTTIGFNSDINPSLLIDITNLDDIQEMTISGTPFWLGFIPENVKIVYSFEIGNCTIANEGYYYYISDNSYLYEFAKYLKDKKIKNDITFIVYVTDFIRKYFSTLYNPIDRDQLHHLIYDANNLLYEPIKEHSIIDFKGKGAALCSEYSALFQNILSAFGYESIYIHGEIDHNGESNLCHAFNIITMDDKYTIVDPSVTINCIDYNKKVQKIYPYIYELDDYNDEDLNNFLLGDYSLELEDLEAQIINDQCYTFSKTKKRVYRVDQLHKFYDEENLYNNQKIVL